MKRKEYEGMEKRTVKIRIKKGVLALMATLGVVGFVTGAVAGDTGLVSGTLNKMDKAAQTVQDVKAAKDATMKAVEDVTGKAKQVIPEYVDINTQKSCPDIKGLKKDMKSVNHFSHKAHIEYLQKEEKGFVCATCHKGAKTEEDILKGDPCKMVEKEIAEAGSVKNFYHGTCLKCHKDLKKEGKPTGPTSCKGCHSRKGGDK